MSAVEWYFATGGEFQTLVIQHLGIALDVENSIGICWQSKKVCAKLLNICFLMNRKVICGQGLNTTKNRAPMNFNLCFTLDSKKMMLTKSRGQIFLLLEKRDLEENRNLITLILTKISED